MIKTITYTMNDQFTIQNVLNMTNVLLSEGYTLDDNSTIQLDRMDVHFLGDKENIYIEDYTITLEGFNTKNAYDLISKLF